MKVFRSCCFLLVAGLLCAGLNAKTPWGLLDNTVEDDTFMIYAVDNLIDKRPIRYAVSQRVTPDEETIFRENILKWPADTLQLIIKSERTKEFQDIIPILQTPLRLQKVSLEQEPDVYFDIRENPPCNDAVACFMGPQDLPYSVILVAAENRQDVKTLSLHEIGHYFGLSDQYEQARHSNSHPEYSSDPDEENSSVMDDKSELTWDDADGLINLIDLRLAQDNAGRFSARAQKGWRSLNPRSQNVYQNAKTITRQRFDAWEDAWYDTDVIYLREYEKGNLQQQMIAFTESPIHVFHVGEKDRVTQDPNTRLIQSVYTQLDAFQGPQSATKIMWEKHFTYGKPTVCEGKKCISVSVREVVNGREIRRRQISVLADGSLDGDVCVPLTPTLYVATDMGTTVTFKIENRQVTFYALRNKDMEIDVRGFPGQNELFRFRGEERETCTLPLQGDCEELSRYYKLYEVHQKHLMSFYQNFYEPLFGVKQGQVRAQVKKSLGTRA